MNGDEKKNRTGKVVGEIIGALISLFIVNNILSWHVPFITNEFMAWIPIANSAIVANMVVRVLLFSAERGAIRNLLAIFYALINLVSTYTLYVLYPFNFGAISLSWVDIIVRIGMIIGIIALSITVLVNAIKLITNSK